MDSSVSRLDLRQLRIQAKELLRAVRAGNADALARALPYFAPSTQFSLANAQLVLARENGFESWPKLREHFAGSDLARTSSPGAQLFDSIESGNSLAVTEILRQTPELARIMRRSDWGWTTPLHVAAIHNNVEMAKALVEAGGEVYAVNQGDYPPVFEAVSRKNQEVADYLLEVSAEKDSGLPPTYGCGIDIVLAGRLGLLDRVQMQVERDPLAVYRRGCIGESVLHWPAHNGYTEIISYLLDNGALIEADEIGLYGGKPLHWAAEHSPKSVEVLLSRGADPVSRNKMKGKFEGFTPLHTMARQPEQEIECARLLLAAGADPDLLDANGRRPIDVARDAGRERTVEFLGSL